jgi:hypothetical protein
MAQTLNLPQQDGILAPYTLRPAPHYQAPTEALRSRIFIRRRMSSPIRWPT